MPRSLCLMTLSCFLCVQPAWSRPLELDENGNFPARLMAPEPKAKPAPLDCAARIDEGIRLLGRKYGAFPEDLSPERYQATLQAETEPLGLARETFLALSARLRKSTALPEARNAYRNGPPSPATTLRLGQVMTDAISGIPHVKPVMVPDSQGGGIQLFLEVIRLAIPVSIPGRGEKIWSPELTVDELLMPTEELRAKLDSTESYAVRNQALMSFMGAGDSDLPLRLPRYASADEYFDDLVVGKLGIPSSCFPAWAARTQSVETVIQAAGEMSGGLTATAVPPAGARVSQTALKPDAGSTPVVSTPPQKETRGSGTGR